MASINWLKMSTQRAGSMIKHNGKEERLQVEHDNPDIDKSLTYLNYTIGSSDYKEMFQHLKERIKEVDALYPPLRMKSDRITSVMLYTPCPMEIKDAGKDKAFFADVHKVFEDFFGKENVMGSCIHYDEQHEYIDHKDKRMSLIHSHTLVAAYAEWKDKGVERAGINGKNFETKPRLTALNKAVCDMVREKYGMEYNTGEEPRKIKTEKLKVESLKAEQKALEADIKNKVVDRALLITPETELPKKRLMESKESYEDRLQIEETKKALVQEKQRLENKEKNLDASFQAKTKDFQRNYNKQVEAINKRYALKERELSRRESKIITALNKIAEWFRAHMTPKKKKEGREHYYYKQMLEQKELERIMATEYEQQRLHFLERNSNTKNHQRYR